MTTLSNSDIEHQMNAGQLVRNGDTGQIGPACYELRMGSVYYDLTEGDQRIEIPAQGTVLIKPGHRVVLITMEELAIPLNVIARVSSKGSLFSIGLTAVNTYADPGFEGNLGIVTQNVSDKYIVLPVGEAIAKVDFSLLSSESSRPYRGQHGFQTQIWPIRHQLQKTHAQVRSDPRVGSEDTEAYKILPAATASALRIIRKRQRLINWSLLIALLINALVLAAVSTKVFDTSVSIITNLLSSAIIAVFMWISRETKE